MRDRDRWWRLLVLAGIACGIAGIAVPYHLVTNELTPAENQFVTDAEYRQWIGIDIFLGLVLLICGVTLIIMAVRAHRRHLLRLEAFAGAVDVMPLANIRTEPAAADDVATQPLELMWRNSRMTSFHTLIIAMQGLLAMLTIAAAAFLLIETLFHNSPMSIWEVIPRVAGAIALVAILVGLVTLIVRVFPFLLGRPFGVTATDTGIDARTEFGARIHMDWDEVQLLEVVGADANAFRRFYLYAPGKRIGWAEYMARFGADYVPAGISSSEMRLRQVALLNLIVARTGLPPRTLVKWLQYHPASTDESKRSTGVIILLACALVLAGITAADFLSPIAPIAWLRDLSTGALALAIPCILFSALRIALIQREPIAHNTPPSVSAPALDASGLAYILSWRPPLGRRVRLIVVGLALAVNLIPAELLLLVAFGVALPGLHPQNLYVDSGDFMLIGRSGMVIVHGLAGIIGAGLAYPSMIVASERVRADQSGLTTERGRQQQLIVWSSIQYIMWGSWDGEFRYWVVSNVPTIQASWPAGSQATNVIPPDGGALPIGAHELAALVAAQIGKPIRIREGR